MYSDSLALSFEPKNEENIFYTLAELNWTKPMFLDLPEIGLSEHCAGARSGKLSNWGLLGLGLIGLVRFPCGTNTFLINEKYFYHFHNGTMAMC